MQANKTKTPATQTAHWQRFSVPYEYPVYFTEKLFDPENTVLCDALARVEPDKRHRCVIFVDEGVSSARASLIAQIEDYAQQHSDHIDLAAAPVIIPGGEKIKSDLHFVEQLQQTLFDHHIDRHPGSTF